MKGAILSAAVEAVTDRGLTDWTIEDVARRARCAKGLVIYHFRSKADLLGTVATTLRDERINGRLAAAQHPGSQALDRLWTAATNEVNSGRFAAWVGLTSAEERLRLSTAIPPEAAEALAAALGRALGLGNALQDEARLIQATLDGLQLQLLLGAPRPRAEESWHRFWLRMLP